MTEKEPTERTIEQHEALRAMPVGERHAFYLRHKGLETQNLIDAFSVVERGDFIPVTSYESIFREIGIDIGHGQVNSWPTIVVRMLEKLQPKEGEKILDVGSGSGWTTALLSHCVGENGKVVGVERIAELVEYGETNLRKYRHTGNAEIYHTPSGVIGWVEDGPYDKILVSAQAESVSEELVEQLAEGGEILIPIAETEEETRAYVKKEFEEYARKHGKQAPDKEMQNFLGYMLKHPGSTAILYRKVNGKLEQIDVLPNLTFVPLILDGEGSERSDIEPSPKPEAVGNNPQKKDSEQNAEQDPEIQEIMRYLKGVRERIEKCISAYIDSINETGGEQSDTVPSPSIETGRIPLDDVSDPIIEAYKHSLLGGEANRMRPALAYITAEMFGIDPDKIDKYCFIMELLHTASLILDDIQDKSTKRRGVNALHIQFGEDRALLTVVDMLTNAFRLVSVEDGNNNLNGKLNEYMSRICDKSGLSGGQLKDLELRDTPPEHVDVKYLDEVSYLKTGLAIQSAIMGTFMIAKPECPEETKQYFVDYAYHLGVAWQVSDDLLDVLKSGDETGKDENQDAKNNKPNYVTLLEPDGAQEKLDSHLAQAQRCASELEKLGYDVTKYRGIIKVVSVRHLPTS